MTVTPAGARSEPATKVDFESPVVRENPYELYARWRATEPVRRGTIGEWYLTRYDDVLMVLGEPALFSSNLVGTRLYEEQIRRLRADDNEFVFADESMLRADPPDHTRLRKRLPHVPSNACARGSNRSWTSCSTRSTTAPSS